MARPRTAKEDDKLKCLKCGSGDQSNFYSTKDPMRRFFGKIPYCKDCIKELYLKYLRGNGDNPNLAIYYLCRKIDVPYIHTSYLGALENISNPNSKIQGEDGIVSAYMKNFAFAEKNGWGTSFDDSQGEGEIDGITSFAEMTKVKRKKMYSDMKTDSDKYVEIEYDTQELILKWGNFDIEDLAFLQNEYLDWEEKLGKATIQEKSTDMFVKEVCKTYNEIRKDRETGINVDKKLDTLQKLLKTSGLVEKQSEVNKVESIGMPIRDIEFRRPIKEVDPEFSDVDGMKDMVDSMTGGLCRSLQIENYYTKRLDEVMGRYGFEMVESLFDQKQKVDLGDEDGE